MANWNSDGGLQWRPLSPFGIEVQADLSEPMSAAQRQRFISLFREGGLILARGQRIELDQQVALMSLLGPIVPRIDCIGYLSSEADYGTAKAELSFHAEYAFGSHPLQGLSLCAIDVEDDTSSTRFANAERAYSALPEPLRAALATHAVEMVSGSVDAVILRACDLPNPDVVLRKERPSILHNPRSGRTCIGVNEMHAAKLVGMSWEQSRAVLNAVYEHLYAPSNILEHVWRKGDIVIWDNVTAHHARGSLAHVGRRVLQRVCIGEKGLYEMFPVEFPSTETPYVPGEPVPA